MPVMDGIALALRGARLSERTILLMTGYADQRERAQGLDLRADHRRYDESRSRWPRCAPR